MAQADDDPREYGDAGCRDRVIISPDEYERVRNGSTLFILRPHHEAATPMWFYPRQRWGMHVP